MVYSNERHEEQEQQNISLFLMHHFLHTTGSTPSIPPSHRFEDIDLVRDGRLRLAQPVAQHGRCALGPELFDILGGRDNHTAQLLGLGVVQRHDRIQDLTCGERVG